jgi:hypothetical protein
VIGWIVAGCESDPDVVPTWTAGPSDEGSHSWWFEADVDPPAEASVTCVAEDDPEEIHVLDSPPATHHAFVLYGLLADTPYACVLRADTMEVDRAFTTLPLAEFLPVPVLTAGVPVSAYTLLNHAVGTYDGLMIVDGDGRIRWTYAAARNSTADIAAEVLGSGEILYGGGEVNPPTVVDLSGAVVRVAGPSSTGGEVHHETSALATGEVSFLTTAVNTSEADTWVGFAVDLLTADLGTLVWTWNSQRGVDDGWLPPGAGDPYHANAAQLDEEAVYVNLYGSGVVAKIDRSTGAGVWTFGPGGTFTLLDPGDWFYGSHAPEIEGDRILLYDNGVRRPSPSPYSRLAEFSIDEAAGTARLEWEYTEPGWYEPIWGDVDRLADGNVLFTRAHCDICDGGDGTTEIVEVAPATNEVVWRLSFPEGAGYRAERIDGCAIFANAKYCPGR